MEEVKQIGTPLQQIKTEAENKVKGKPVVEAFLYERLGLNQCLLPIVNYYRSCFPTF